MLSGCLEEAGASNLHSQALPGSEAILVGLVLSSDGGTLKREKLPIDPRLQMVRC